MVALGSKIWKLFAPNKSRKLCSCPHYCAFRKEEKKSPLPPPPVKRKKKRVQLSILKFYIYIMSYYFEKLHPFWRNGSTAPSFQTSSSTLCMPCSNLGFQTLLKNYFHQCWYQGMRQYNNPESVAVRNVRRLVRICKGVLVTNVLDKLFCWCVPFILTCVGMYLFCMLCFMCILGQFYYFEEQISAKPSFAVSIKTQFNKNSKLILILTIFPKYFLSSLYMSSFYVWHILLYNRLLWKFSLNQYSCN